MDALGAVLRKGSSSAAARSDDDQFYEDMEAPKFVDFTVPDHSRPDDRSWFCARIGCDENHEEVDPDALYKSFVLRVMAARSPNVRLQKALKRQQAPSAIARCPRSAPAKPVKGRATKLGALGSISEKMGIPSKLKVHPISSLRSTPNHVKAAKRPPTTEKAMTTPRSRLRPPSEEPFRSAKSCRARPPAPKSNTVVKALTFQTPKKDEHAATPARRTPIQELSVGMKKIRMGSNPRATEVAGSNAQPRKPLSKVRENPMDLDACRVQTGHEEKDPQGKPGGSGSCGRLGEEKGEKQMTGNSSSSSDFDEDKENAVQTYNTNRNMDPGTVNNGTENCQNKNPNKPLKAIVVPSKTTTHDPHAQGTKYKPLKPTNPKPFRLRTDERGILREANLERGKPQKETPVTKTQGRTKLDPIKSGRLDEPETVPSTQGKPMEDCEEKSSRKTQNKAKLTVPRQMLKPQSVTESESASSATLRSKERACGAQGENSTNLTTTTMSPQVKRAITIPKEPVFHKIHIPKDCTKRLEKAN
ncbi:hypothetical protein Taro_033005 [Colocasia esculenta]|uniref:Uncharacterized protein n=1 Tax=Colocasia esculenta TaxID=4460 RepID=A0A843WB73_COLES|nr:hypothetical protein [Colocasia esculenta]